MCARNKPYDINNSR